jgi:hypothetical protein
MKRWAILMAVVAVILVCLVGSYAGVPINGIVPRLDVGGARSPYGNAERARSPYGDADTDRSPYSSPTGPTSPARAPLDPNKVAAAVRAFPGLEKQLELVGKGSRNEVAEWLRPVTSMDNRARLSREVQRQVEMELELLRKIADEEGAKKTVAAIDGVLLWRETRLERLTEMIQEEIRKSQRTGSGSVRGRTSSAYSPRGRTSSNRVGTAPENGPYQQEEPVQPEPEPTRRTR